MLSCALFLALCLIRLLSMVRFGVFTFQHVLVPFSQANGSCKILLQVVCLGDEWFYGHDSLALICCFLFISLRCLCSTSCCRFILLSPFWQYCFLGFEIYFIFVLAGQGHLCNNIESYLSHARFASVILVGGQNKVKISMRVVF